MQSEDDALRIRRFVARLQGKPEALPDGYVQRFVAAITGNPAALPPNDPERLEREASQRRFVAAVTDQPVHHIVPRTLKKFPEADKARAILTKFGISTENAANGVYLPSTFDDAVKAAYHGSVHTKEYYQQLFSRLKRAKSKEDVLLILDEVRKALLTGTFPH